MKEVSTKGREEEWVKDGSMDPQEKKQVFASPLFLGVIIISTAERLLLADQRSEIQRSCKKLRFIPVKTKLSGFDQK